MRQKSESQKSLELAIRRQDGKLNKFLHERGALDTNTRDLATLVILLKLKQKMADVKKERTPAQN